MTLDLEDDRGVVAADQHYLATGHRVHEKIKIEKGWFTTKVFKRFKCERCDFQSFAGKLIKSRN